VLEGLYKFVRCLEAHVKVLPMAVLQIQMTKLGQVRTLDALPSRES